MSIPAKPSTVLLPVPLIRVSLPDVAPPASPKDAVTFFAALMVTTQVLVPVQSPLQPVNVLPAAAIALSVTDAPLAISVLHVPTRHTTPDGLLVTIPEPVPERVTPSGKVLVALVANVAVTLFAADMLTVQVVPTAPAQAPPHAVNVPPVVGVAVKVTLVPLA